jgi:hypothetical protein
LKASFAEEPSKNRERKKMLGRPVLYTIAAAAISVLSASGASAGCYSCGCSAPVFTYVSPCAAYAAPPMYVINQGPAYTRPVYPLAAVPTPAYPYIGMRRYGMSAYYADEAPFAYRRPYRAYRGYGLGLDLRYRHRHHHRPHIGMRHFHHDGYRHAARMHRMHMMHRTPMMHRMPMRMPRGPMPGVVHPQGKY